MEQVLHGSARRTAAVRRAIQHSQESLKALARRHGLNQWLTLFGMVTVQTLPLSLPLREVDV